MKDENETKKESDADTVRDTRNDMLDEISRSLPQNKTEESPLASAAKPKKSKKRKERVMEDAPFRMYKLFPSTRYNINDPLYEVEKYLKPDFDEVVLAKELENVLSRLFEDGLNQQYVVNVRVRKSKGMRYRPKIPLPLGKTNPPQFLVRNKTHAQAQSESFINWLHRHKPTLNGQSFGLNLRICELNDLRKIFPEPDNEWFKR